MGVEAEPRIRGGKRGKDRKERGEDKGRGELGVMVGMQKETGGEAFEWH